MSEGATRLAAGRSDGAADVGSARWSVRRLDVALAAVALVGGQLDLALYGVGGDPLAAHVLWAVVAGAVLVRRAAPGAFWAFALGLFVVRSLGQLTPFGGTTYVLVMPVALFGLAAYATPPSRGALRAAAGLAAYLAVGGAMGLADVHPLGSIPPMQWLLQLTMGVVAIAGGFALCDRTEALRSARTRAATAPDERTTVGGALSAERARIARDLHAVVTECVRTVLDEVAAARSSLAPSVAATRAAVGRAAAASRHAIAEMRRLLVVLRGRDGEQAPVEPVPATVEQLERRLEALGGRGGGVHAWLQRRPWVRDLGVPLLVLALGLVEVWWVELLPVPGEQRAGTAERLLGTLLAALAFLPRRRWPLVTVTATALILLGRQELLGDLGVDTFTQLLVLSLAAFAGGAYARSLPQAVAALAIVLAAATLKTLAEPFEPALGMFVYAYAILASGWVTGVGGRRRLAEAAELRALTEREERRREQAARRAVEQERLRVARELHDLVGHGLTSIVLQCAVADRCAGERPRDAQTALDAVDEVGEEVLRELHALLAALDGSERGAAPQLARLPELVRRVRADGLVVALELVGDLDDVPAGQSAAAYRIVQEALTNARKHGGAAPVTARVARAGDGLAIDVRSAAAAAGIDASGPGGARGAAAVELGSSGWGLAGMRERVRVYDGDFAAGPEPDGTWAVRALLPLGGTSAEVAVPR